MTEEQHSSFSPSADTAPTWLRALQAGLLGLVAGLVLHAIVAVGGAQARTGEPAHAGPKECKKSSPARDAVAPATAMPAQTSSGFTPAL